jgi:hypothetical protein
LSTFIDKIAGSFEPLIWKLADRLPFMGFLVAWRERLFAKRESAVMLTLFHSVRNEYPQLKGAKLYEQVVARRLECDVSIAHEIVKGAEESFAQWPNWRDLMFRDVVNFLIVNHLLMNHANSVGTRANMEEVLALSIPSNL